MVCCCCFCFVVQSTQWFAIRWQQSDVLFFWGATGEMRSRSLPGQITWTVGIVQWSSPVWERLARGFWRQSTVYCIRAGEWWYWSRVICFCKCSTVLLCFQTSRWHFLLQIIFIISTYSYNFYLLTTHSKINSSTYSFVLFLATILWLFFRLRVPWQ